MGNWLVSDELCPWVVGLCVTSYVGVWLVHI